MPSNIVKSYAEKYNLSQSETEKAWDRAKTLTKDQYGDIENSDSEKFYSIVTTIFKNIIKGSKKDESLDEMFGMLKLRSPKQRPMDLMNSKIDASQAIKSVENYFNVLQREFNTKGVSHHVKRYIEEIKNMINKTYDEYSLKYEK